VKVTVRESGSHHRPPRDLCSCCCWHGQALRHHLHSAHDATERWAQALVAVAAAGVVAHAEAVKWEALSPPPLPSVQPAPQLLEVLEASQVWIFLPLPATRCSPQGPQTRVLATVAKACRQTQVDPRSAATLVNRWGPHCHVGVAATAFYPDVRQHLAQPPHRASLRRLLMIPQLLWPSVDGRPASSSRCPACWPGSQGPWLHAPPPPKQRRGNEGCWVAQVATAPRTTPQQQSR